MKTREIRTHCGGTWTARADGWWRSVALAEVPALAQAMKDREARFAALTVRLAGTMLKLAWHWDFQGALLSCEGVAAQGEAVPSLAAIWPGADWAEREARDYYALTFTGRETTPPLMLRDGDTPGVLLPGREAQA